MPSKHFLASAPGSVFLLGEHAVLEGHSALVCAVDYRIEVEITLRDDDCVSIHSSLGDFESTLDDLRVQKPFEFLIAAVLLFKDKLKSGLDINVKSAFSHQVGLGSSAAVVVAAVAALRCAVGFEEDSQAIFDTAFEVVQSVQGCGSGGDIAASVYGGVVHYKPGNGVLECFKNDLPLGLFYSGAKTPTPEVIRYVTKRFENDKEKLLQIYKQIGDCVEQGVAALKQHDLQKLADVFAQQQICMNELGVNNEALTYLIDQLSSRNEIKAVKISGSGLGDCVVALGDCSRSNDNPAYIPINLSMKGVSISKQD